MFESTAQTRTRDAIRAAHAERGAAFAGMMKSLFSRQTSR
ncbi:hypothetical protein PSA7680_03603 [Pseudoruegeria aquimaris]|uniref:Uncharacterized protein n=1 Tax=Pseudoruegeria aquimaris TaxID=393663 RepID=A0A1Y5TP11_9RHOB|nr:hypothetical protein PSA7680_03603 [Pseudoruegeria aquimaris]